MRFRSLLLLSLGTVWLVAAQEQERPVPNLGPDLPRIMVHCGEVGLLFRQKSQWTPGRIDFDGVPMTTERSAYGTVFLFPDVGFIGTGHLENEPEDLQSVSFILDDTPVGEPGELLEGDHFRFERDSRIRDFRLQSVIEVRDNRLYETATISTEKEVPLDLVYHFMHAWKPEVSAFLAGGGELGEMIESGALPNEDEVDRKFYLQKPVDWIAVFDPESSQYAVSYILEIPEGVDHDSQIWNVIGTYRKYYLTSFREKTVPAGFSGSWRMVTAFGKSSAETWEQAARDLLARVKKEEKKAP